MNSSQKTILSPREVSRILVTHAKRWVIPAAIIAAVAIGYAVVRPATWEASQTLILRNEAANNERGPGKFDDADQMKTLQETTLEVVKSRGVLAAALGQVGPPADYEKDEAAWPSDRDVEGVRKTIKLSPPKGAEFGTTEIFYLKVRAKDRNRALSLNRAICDQLLLRSQQLRDEKAQSMVRDLVKTVDLARSDLAESTARLSKIEKQVGSDLAELRFLNDSNSGDSALRRIVTEIRNELRQIRATHRANEELLELLGDAQDDPGRLLATPNRLLESEPSLRRLKEGLLDAQLATASLKGTMSDEHPVVVAAKQAEEEISRHLHDELAIAVRGLQVEAELSSDREAMLDQRLAGATRRLAELAELRAPYSNRVTETAHRTSLVERAEQNLAEARAAHASANASSLLSRIDGPDTGSSPVGLGRSTIGLAGIAGGLFAGFGLLFLTVPPLRPVVPETASAAVPAAAHAPAAPAAGPSKPVAFPVDSLSFKQALHKITYGGRV